MHFPVSLLRPFVQARMFWLLLYFLLPVIIRLKSVGLNGSIRDLFLARDKAFLDCWMKRFTEAETIVIIVKKINLVKALKRFNRIQ